MNLSPIYTAHSTIHKKQEFAKVGDTRSDVECGTMLNQINMSNGHFDDTVTSLLSLQRSLALTGDFAQLAAQTALLLQALVRLGKTDDGKVLAASTLQAIEQASFFTIDKKALARKNEDTKALQTQSMLTVKTGGATKAGAASRMGTTASSTSILGKDATRSRAVVEEASFDGVTAFGAILSVYMDVIVEDAVKMAAEKVSAGGFFMRIFCRGGCFLHTVRRFHRERFIILLHRLTL
jgi:hypothetical protein